MRTTLACAFLAVVAVACKSTNSAVLETPVAEGEAVEQGGAVVKNKCNAGGHAGQTTGTGWVFDAKEGCYLDCKSEAALKKDYLKQLHSHRVYGKYDLIAAQDPAAAELAKYFAESQAAKGVKLNRFDGLTEAQLFDGAKWKTMDIRPGDIFLNMNFGQPNHAGIFYSKRGISHTRLVVDVKPDAIYTFDGGWEHFSKLKEVNAQTVWVRPRASKVSQTDLKNLVKWAKTMEPAPYDNALIDDWKEFRVVLHKLLDQNVSQAQARKQAFAWAAENNKAPGSMRDSFTFVPPSGLYCSEGTAGIYSYIGFRQYGETAVDIITAFSKNGQLPDWKLYEDALSGFGADSEESIYMMHKLFYEYFRAFETGRKMGVIRIPGIDDATSMTFAKAAEANLVAVEADGGASNHIDTQLNDLDAALAQAGEAQATTRSQLQQLRAGLEQARTSLVQRMGTEMNLTQAVYALFYSNRAYGPHTFFENGKYFEFKGVFYNSNLQGNQALYISDWWMQTFGQPMLKANIQTTLYRVTGNQSLPDDQCVVAEKAPVIKTH